MTSNDTCNQEEKIGKQPNQVGTNPKTLYFIRENEIFVFNDVNINDCFSLIGNLSNSNKINIMNQVNAKDFANLTQKNIAKTKEDMQFNNIKNLDLNFYKKIQKKHFTAQEDNLLSSIISSVGENDWNYVSKIMRSNKFDRNARQCKDRYYHYLDPKININFHWKPEEDELLMKKVEEEGKKWKLMEKFFPGRTEVSLRNRYNLLLRKNNNKKGRKQNISSSSFSFLDSINEDCKKQSKSTNRETDENNANANKSLLFDYDESLTDDFNDSNIFNNDEEEPVFI